MERMRDERTVKIVAEWRPESRKTRGGPTMQRDAFVADLKDKYVIKWDITAKYRK